MKQLILLSAAFAALTSCSQNTRHTNDRGTTKTDTTVTQAIPANEEKGLFGKMQIKENIKSGDPVLLKFTVYNRADTAAQFCKWHTPFEPLMSKYLDLKNERGEEVSYKGAMAKRISPPPADSYIKVASKDSLSVDVDLLKGYAIEKPGKYSIVYTGQNISGLMVKDSVSFVYIK